MNKYHRNPQTERFLKRLRTFAGFFLLFLFLLFMNVQAGKANRLDVPTDTPNLTVSITDTANPAPTDTQSNTATPVPTDTQSNTDTATSQPTSTPAPTNTPVSTDTPVQISTSTSTLPVPSNTSTPAPSSTTVPSDTPIPTQAPSDTSTAVPTQVPSDTSTSTPTLTLIPSNTPIPTGTVQPTLPNNHNFPLIFNPLISGCPNPTSSDYAQQLVDYINQQRCLQSLPPVKRVSSLDGAAQGYATVRSQADVWNTDHSSYNQGVKQDWQDRLYAVYPDYFALGENTGTTNSSAQGTVNDWMNSSDTSANILSTSFTEIGAGYATKTPGTYQPFWVADFGADYNDLYPLIINNNAPSTNNPTVSLYIGGAGTFNSMCLVNGDPNSNNSPSCNNWVDFQSSYSWLLASGSSGTRKVFLNLKNSANPSRIVQTGTTIQLTTSFNDLSVSIATATPNGPYEVTQDGQINEQYTGVAGGPVNVVTDEGGPFVTSARVQYSGNYNELMGYPANQLTTTYWFPWYDTTTSGKTDTIVVSNPGSTSASVSIYIAGTDRGDYTVPANGSISKSYASLQTGPVKVISTNGVNIITSQRLTYKSSFTEIMGYPANQLAQTYWFPWYDYKTSGMTDTIRVSNPSSANGSVKIYIAGSLEGTYTVNAGAVISKTYSGVNGGPIEVTCTTSGVNILPVNIVDYTSSENEDMGYPDGQLTSQYWFPWYDGSSDTIYVSNPSASSATVDIYIAGVKQGEYPVAANGSISENYSGLQAGPVKVIGTNSVNFIASERTLVTSSALSETIGFLFSQLTTQYYFPYYDNSTSGWQSFIWIAR